MVNQPISPTFFEYISLINKFFVHQFFLKNKKLSHIIKKIKDDNVYSVTNTEHTYHL